MSIDSSAISGVVFFAPKLNPDGRGSLDVVYSTNWAGVPPMRQWNIVRSRAGTLRGLHAHSRYDELYLPIVGRMFIALVDARRDSATFGRQLTAWLDQADNYRAVLVPVGVLHGIYFEGDGILGYGLSWPWTGDNEYKCAWNDPELAIGWPTREPILSDEDRAAGRYSDLVDRFHLDIRGA